MNDKITTSKISTDQNIQDLEADLKADTIRKVDGLTISLKSHIQTEISNSESSTGTNIQTLENTLKMDTSTKIDKLKITLESNINSKIDTLKAISESYALFIICVYVLILDMRK